jgi:hypothetical protein
MPDLVAHVYGAPVQGWVNLYEESADTRERWFLTMLALNGQWFA